MPQPKKPIPSVGTWPALRGTIIPEINRFPADAKELAKICKKLGTLSLQVIGPHGLAHSL